MIQIKKEQEASVKQLFRMTTTEGGNLAILKELTKEYFPGQEAVTCWTCPSSANAMQRKLCKHLRNWEVEPEVIVEEKPKETPKPKTNAKGVKRK